jgi:hypothetical protein
MPVCTAFRSSHARLGAANPEKWHHHSVRKGAPTARVPSLGCLAALVLDPKAVLRAVLRAALRALRAAAAGGRQLLQQLGALRLGLHTDGPQTDRGQDAHRRSNAGRAVGGGAAAPAGARLPPPGAGAHAGAVRGGEAPHPRADRGGRGGRALLGRLGGRVRPAAQQRLQHVQPRRAVRRSRDAPARARLHAAHAGRRVQAQQPQREGRQPRRRAAGAAHRLGREPARAADAAAVPGLQLDLAAGRLHRGQRRYVARSACSPPQPSAPPSAANDSTAVRAQRRGWSQART